jgi:lipopolysaccharide assembly outer membrane protein LptD (OstA)
MGEAARQLAELRLGSGYDFEQGRILNLFFEGEFRPVEGLSLDVDLGYDPKDDQMEEALARFSWGDPTRNHLGVTYRYLREFNPVFDNYGFSDDVFDEADADFDRVNQLGLDGRYLLTPRFELFGDVYLSFEDNRAQRATLGLVYHSRCLCWDLVVAARQKTRPSQTELLVQIRLAGMGFGPTRR